MQNRATFVLARLCVIIVLTLQRSCCAPQIRLFNRSSQVFPFNGSRRSAFINQ
jgi:hypothetical protein